MSYTARDSEHELRLCVLLGNKERNFWWLSKEPGGRGGEARLLADYRFYGLYLKA